MSYDPIPLSAEAPCGTVARQGRSFTPTEVSLILLATLACLAVMQAANTFFIPIAIALLGNYVLSPMVEWLARRRVPRWLSASLLVLGTLGATGWVGYAMSGDAAEMISALPEAAQKFRATLAEKPKDRLGMLATLQKAADVFQEAQAKTSPRSPVAKVEVLRPRFDVHDYVWTGTKGLASFTGQVGTVTFLLLFLLMSGDLFRHKLIGIFGTDSERERSTRKMLEDISTQVQRYLLIQIGSSVLAGLAVGVTYAFLGVDKPLMWGIVTAVLHMVPYIGALVATALATFMAFVQFGTFGVPMAVLISSVGIHTLIGQLLVPLLTSKVSTLNTVTVFVSVLAWGWLWGVWGLLLGIPITMALKAICDQVEGFRGIGELLGN